MAVESRSSLWLGQGALLHQYDASARRFVRSFDLGAEGVSSIEGLALDRSNQTLVLLDGPSRQLIELRLSALR